jgi:chitosanase
MAELEKEKLDKIKKVINMMEMGVPNLKYDDITILPDGPNGRRQITLSVGFTEYGGNLKKVVETYIKKEGKYAKDFEPYVDKIGKTSLVNDHEFINLLKTASKEDQLMKDAQDKVYEDVYIQPALNWAKSRGFEKPLSLLVVIDSFLQSGQVFAFLRNRFSEKTPIDGGDEKDWITAYIETRHFWLKNHTNKAVRNSSYRTKDYLKMIADNNWNLDAPVVANGKRIP